MSGLTEVKATNLLPFPGGKTWKCNGGAKADAIEVMTWDDVTSLSARIKSTGNLDHAWMAMPADPDYLRWLADTLRRHADWIEAAR